MKICMKISLVTTVRNEAASATALIEAVSRQTRPPDEWVVVDGGSTDGTAEVFAGSGRCTVQVVPGGISAGRNAAIAASHHPLVAVTDAGCRPDPDWLEHLVVPLESGRADVVLGATRPDLRTPIHAAQWIILDQFTTRRWRWHAPAPSSRSCAFLRTTWAAIGYPEWLAAGEDSWLVDRWRRSGWRVAEQPEAVVTWDLPDRIVDVYRQHRRNMRGEGRGLLHSGRHLTRLAFYAGLAGGTTVGALGTPVCALVWIGYLSATAAARGPLALAGRSPRFGLRALAWLPVVLLVADLAKIEGWVRGVVSRIGTGGRR